MHSHARTSAKIDATLLLSRSLLPLIFFSGNRGAKFSKKNESPFLGPNFKPRFENLALVRRLRRERRRSHDDKTDEGKAPVNWRNQRQDFNKRKPSL
jgi:hypothetical protein